MEVAHADQRSDEEAAPSEEQVDRATIERDIAELLSDTVREEHMPLSTAVDFAGREPEERLTPSIHPPEQRAQQRTRAAEHLRRRQTQEWMAATGRTVRAHLTEAEQVMLWDCFQLLDADNSGTISSAELLSALNELGFDLTIDEAKRMVEAADRDRSGEIDFNEFMLMMSGTPMVPQHRASQDSPVLPFSILSTAFRRSGLMRTVLSDNFKEQRRLYHKSVREEEQRKTEMRRVRTEAAMTDAERYPHTAWSQRRLRQQYAHTHAQKKNTPHLRGQMDPTGARQAHPVTSGGGRAAQLHVVQAMPAKPTKHQLSTRLAALTLMRMPAFDINSVVGLPSPRALATHERRDIGISSGSRVSTGSGISSASQPPFRDMLATASALVVDGRTARPLGLRKHATAAEVSISRLPVLRSL